MKRYISISLVMLTVILMLPGCNSNKSFSQAREQTIEFFISNQSGFEIAKDTVLTTGSTDTVSMDNISYIGFYTVETSEMITFDYDSQGMLGGQYWGIVYSSDNIPRFEQNILSESDAKEVYYWQEPNGNNFYILERICENWFFYYMDYDGRLNASDLNAN